MNKNILSIETTTKICSVSLFSNDHLISIKEDYNRNHSSLLGKYIDEIFYSQKIKPIDLDAIALSIDSLEVSPTIRVSSSMLCLTFSASGEFGY